MSAENLMRGFKTRNIWFVFVVGAAIFVIFINEIGYGRLLLLISNANKQLVPLVILLNILNLTAFTMSWKYLIPVDISFYKLFKFYTAGTFINNITPTFGVGGEPVKAILLGKEIGASKSFCFASVVSQRMLNMFTFLVIELMGITLLFYSPELRLGIWQILALLFSIELGFIAFGLLVYFYIRKDRFSSFIHSIIRFSAPFIRLVRRGFDHRAHADAVERSIDSFHIGLKDIRRNRSGLANTIIFSSLGWTFDIMAIYVVFLSLGEAHIGISVLIITYTISMISGWLPLFLPGGLGIVDGTMAALFILSGVPTDVALLATLFYRLGSYWFNTVFGAFYFMGALRL
ncbi:hypothetical protein ANME2D_02885 [Candidatus Methanoperedens nitroreducens]|uniref:Integral membrane protein n=1 Tax=Candidatus Methanoperedens nitratireducens TaxID=1392998 RepID=A0A062V645_9EURY|nr:flippase-like domain-containing protein [Candidatus Methanoperedens nitroreducens]KCZ70860.1 hypothetical protein ANME2D_02885 [Candidatus Methanoperedens nitroreducens]MDJ1420715.1 flippase-like domain-containing protein [Candidatus Methanoperedens sp.]